MERGGERERGGGHGGGGRSRGAIEMLDRCHQKLAEKIDLLLGAAERWSVSRDPEALLDAASVSDFLARAGRRHELDEETSIFPRLNLTGDRELDDVVRVLRAEHRDHEREGLVLAALVVERGGPDPDDLARCVKRLASAYSAHVSLEDAKLMPLVRAFSPETLEAITNEMQARRER